MTAIAPDTVARLVAQLAGTRKYRHVAAETLARVARDALVRGGRDPSRAARARLHQICGAFATERALTRAARALEGDELVLDLDQERALAAQVLDAHASTAERARVLPEFAERLIELAGRPRRVLDLACGLLPMALPWLDPDRALAYYGCDIDTRLVDLGNRFLVRTGRTGRIECADVLGAPRTVSADCALLLKTAPTLEHQEPGATRRVIERTDVPRIVVSFPTASLGGNRKGRSAHYAQWMEALAALAGWKATGRELCGELVYVIDRR